MQESSTPHITLRDARLIGFVLLAEYLVFLLSGVSFSKLAGDPFFSINVDPFFWVFYLARIPQFIISNQWAGIILDSSIVILLLSFLKKPFNNRINILLFLLLLCFYVTLMGYLTHRNFHIGFVVAMLPFLFHGERSRGLAFEATRYFLLFFYFSAAVLKLVSLSFLMPGHFSHHLATQFTPYFLEHNTGIRTSLNLYLVSHPGIADWLYIASIIVEFIVVVGFFTRKYDKWLGILLLIFHCCNWFIMDLGASGQLAFICLLFLGGQLKKG